MIILRGLFFELREKHLLALKVCVFFKICFLIFFPLSELIPFVFFFFSKKCKIYMVTYGRIKNLREVELNLIS